MSTRYRYWALTASDESIEGELDAVTAAEATRTLQAEGLRVNNVEPMEPAPWFAGGPRRLGWQELSLFSEQLRSMVASGLPLPQSLGALAGEMQHRGMRASLEGIRRDLEQGQSLHAAIERRGDAFPQLYGAMVKAGEASGNLPGVLQLLSSYTAHAAKQRQEMLAALTYPAILLLTVLGVACYFSEFVFPDLRILSNEGYLSGMGWGSGIVLFLLVHMAHRSVEMVVFAAAAVALAFTARWAMMRSNKGQILLDTLRLNAWGYGRARYVECVARMNSTLSILLRGRVGMVEAMEIAGTASGSAVIEQAMTQAARRVAMGDRFSDALIATGVFSTDYLWMIGTGEERGDLEEVLETIAQQYTAEAEAHGKVWVIVLNAGAIITVGAVIVLLFAAMYGPMIFGTIAEV